MRKVFHQKELQQINVLDERFYTFDRKAFFPSVTTILDVFPKGFGFHQWLKDVGGNATEIMERAAKIGSVVHKATERLNKGDALNWADEEGKPLYSLEEWSLILRFVDFWQKVQPSILCNEQSFCSSELGYGGTIDRVLTINGKTWLVDIKTSNYIHKTHELQLAAYAVLWNQFNQTKPIQNTGVLWLKAGTKTDKIEDELMQGAGWQLKAFERHYLDSYEVFKHVHAIFKEENPNFKPKNLTYPDRVIL